MEENQTKDFDSLLDETDRSKRIRRYGIVFSTAALVVVVVGLFFGALPGIGFAIVYAYFLNAIIAKPRERKTPGRRR